MRICLSFTAAALVLCWVPLTNAEDFPFTDSAEGEFQKGFGADEGLTESDKELSGKDRLSMGGALSTELQYSRLDLEDASRIGHLSTPNTLWFYLDSKLRNDIRGYVKSKTVYDPTLSLQAKPSFDLEEMKLFFNVNQAAFFTVGKQKIKWGSAKFWNTTDFLNSEHRDLLYADDRRSGVALLKTHVPIGSSNFYVVNRLDSADQLDRVQHSLRAEVPVSTAEFALSGAFMKDKNPTWGFDVSTGIWDLDAYAEVSYTAGSDQQFYGASGPYSDPNRVVTNWVTGISYDYKYSDSDTFTLAAEFFHNDIGYRSTDDYAWVFLNRGYQPYRLSQRYGMVMFFLPSPGNWEKVSFSVFNLANLTDYSGLSKLGATITTMQDLKIDLGFSVHYGNPNGEFQMGGQMIDSVARLLIDF